jgi:hypothetical protein
MGILREYQAMINELPIIYLARHGETAWSVSAQPRLNQILPEARGIVEKALIPVKELA